MKAGVVVPNSVVSQKTVSWRKLTDKQQQFIIKNGPHHKATGGEVKDFAKKFEVMFGEELRFMGFSPIVSPGEMQKFLEKADRRKKRERQKKKVVPSSKTFKNDKGTRKFACMYA